MNKRSHLLYYNSIHEFKRQYYGPLLKSEHLVQRSQIRIKEFFIPGELDPIVEDFWGYHLIKDGLNYLISSSNDDKEEIDIMDLLPIEIQDAQKLADKKGTVYYLVRRPVPKRIRPERAFTNKEFVDNLCLIEHSNPDHQKLIMMMALSQLWDRSYYRISTAAGFGKDASNDICASLFGDCGVIESPTIAKLEDRASVLKWLVVNEVVDINKADWDIIQQFLLTAGAHKNEVTKHSRAFQNVGEIIDTSRFSLSLFYNDIDCYWDKDGNILPYFDTYTKTAVKDRFPAFRLHGTFTEDFNSMYRVDIKRFVLQQDNFDWYVNMIRSFLYYQKNYISHLHNWDMSKVPEFSGRDKTNMGKLLRVVDFYSNTQEEFDRWVNIINESMIDYVTMLGFPQYWSSLKKKVERDCSGLSNSEEEIYRVMVHYKQRLDKLGTFVEKIEQVKRWIKKPDTLKSADKDIFEFGFDEGEIL